MTKIKGPMTAEEARRMFDNDPEYQARIKEQERLLKEHWAFLREVEKPLVTQLNLIGYAVESVWDLVKTRESYKSAFPLLLEHLKVEYHDRIREGIARSLAIRDAKSLFPQLVEIYQNIDQTKFPETKAGLAVALSVTSDDKVFDVVVELLRDRGNGESRILLLSRLRRSKRPAAPGVIDELRKDPQLTREINSWRPRKGR